MAHHSSAFGFQNHQRYGDNRHPALPWGYWLVSAGDIPGQAPLIDEDGREWESVRDAFWIGRLGLPDLRWKDELLEFIANYLAIVDGRFVADEERQFDIFLGDRHLSAFYRAFLEAAGLTDAHGSRLSQEGRAVLQMLITTRTQKDAQDAVGLSWIIANRSAARRSERMETAEQVARSEEVAARMLYRFATDTIASEPAVKLIGLHINHEIPVRSTLWTMTWPVGLEHARNRFYLWLVERIDRWESWSEMVKENGARALTEHLMKLAFCDRFANGEANDSSNAD